MLLFANCHDAVDVLFVNDRAIHIVNRFDRSPNLIQMRKRIKWLVVEYPRLFGRTVGTTDFELMAACRDVSLLYIVNILFVYCLHIVIELF